MLKSLATSIGSTNLDTTFETDGDWLYIADLERFRLLEVTESFFTDRYPTISPVRKMT